MYVCVRVSDQSRSLCQDLNNKSRTVFREMQQVDNFLIRESTHSTETDNLTLFLKSFTNTFEAREISSSVLFLPVVSIVKRK